MFTYLLNRWVARRFEKVDGGYIYRRRPDLEGLLLTEADREEALRAYRRRYWKWWILFLAAFLGIAIIYAIIAMVLELDETYMTFGGYVLAVVMLVLVLKEQREWSLLPERMFADRPSVPSDLPTGGWLVRLQNLSNRRSWPVQILLLIVYGAALWSLTPRSLDASITHWFFFACFGFGFLGLVYGAVWKYRQTS